MTTTPSLMFWSKVNASFIEIKVVSSAEEVESITNFTVAIAQAHCKYWNEEDEAWDNTGCEVCTNKSMETVFLYLPFCCNKSRLYYVRHTRCIAGAGSVPAY